MKNESPAMEANRVDEKRRNLAVDIAAGLVKERAHITSREEYLQEIIDKIEAAGYRLSPKLTAISDEHKEFVKVLKQIQDWLMENGEIKDDGIWNQAFVKANNAVVKFLAKYDRSTIEKGGKG